MKISDTDIRRHLRLGEDGSCEFKQIEFSGDRHKKPDRVDLADELCAFANRDGGIMLCGVDDDGKIHGMSREQMADLDRVLVELSDQTIEPPLRIDVHRRELDGKAFVLVEIPRGEAVHERSGRAYIRQGASKRLLQRDERLRLEQKRTQSRYLWYDKQVVPETGFETLNERLWEPLLSVEGATDPRRGLINLRLLAQDEDGIARATVAGVLLCATSPQDWLPQAVIMATHYRGLDRASEQLDAREIVGPLPLQIADAVQFVVRNMRVAARKTPEREDVPQYGKAAVFEAVVNAVAHRDLFHVFSKDQAFDVQGPTGNRFSRATAEWHDHRKHGIQPGHPQRGDRIGFRPHSGWSDIRLGSSRIFDGTPWRRSIHNSQGNP